MKESAEILGVSPQTVMGDWKMARVADGRTRAVGEPAAHDGRRASRSVERSESSACDHQYEAEGGGYTHASSAAQKLLKAWSDERWLRLTANRSLEISRRIVICRMQPWNALSAEEKKATDRKEVVASEQGKQFVSNTLAAKKAWKSRKAADLALCDSGIHRGSAALR